STGLVAGVAEAESCSAAGGVVVEVIFSSCSWSSTNSAAPTCWSGALSMPSIIEGPRAGIAATRRMLLSRSFDTTLGCETGGQKSQERCAAATFSWLMRSLRWPGLSALTRGSDTSAAWPHAYTKRTWTTDSVIVIAADREISTRTSWRAWRTTEKPSTPFPPDQSEIRSLACWCRAGWIRASPRVGSPTCEPGRDRVLAVLWYAITKMAHIVFRNSLVH